VANPLDHGSIGTTSGDGRFGVMGAGCGVPSALDLQEEVTEAICDTLSVWI
jgi:hypothetical protein